MLTKISRNLFVYTIDKKGEKVANFSFGIFHTHLCGTQQSTFFNLLLKVFQKLYQNEFDKIKLGFENETKMF